MGDRGGSNSHRLLHSDAGVDGMDFVALPVTLHPAAAAQLRTRIATKQRQQAKRRAHAAELKTLIERHDLELANLQAQLDRGVIACRPQSADDAPTAPSADAESSNTPTTPSCPATPTKQANHAH